MKYQLNYFNRIDWLLQEVRVKFYPRKLTLRAIEILGQSFPYYQHLTPVHQEEFKQKLCRILAAKKFVGRGGLEEVTAEMKVLIAATIVMVTFGWKRIRLPHFDKILISPVPTTARLRKVTIAVKSTQSMES